MSLTSTQIATADRYRKEIENIAGRVVLIR